jgi:hypothetical protein
MRTTLPDVQGWAGRSLVVSLATYFGEEGVVRSSMPPLAP